VSCLVGGRRPGVNEVPVLLRCIALRRQDTVLLVGVQVRREQRQCCYRHEALHGSPPNGTTSLPMIITTPRGISPEKWAAYSAPFSPRGRGEIEGSLDRRPRAAYAEIASPIPPGRPRSRHERRPRRQCSRLLRGPLRHHQR